MLYNVFMIGGSMKKYIKIFLAVMVCVFLFTGCEKVNEGNYKEGTYFASVVDSYGGAPAVVYVDSTGMIKSVFLDTTYTKDDVLTTKKTLGDAYNMKQASEVGKERFEQVNLLEAKVVENLNITFMTLNNDGNTDAIAGVTMKIDALYKALENALNQAKK